jgi:hypothetical protein
MFCNLLKGAITSGFVLAPEYSPTSAAVGPLTIPPFAKGIKPPS